MALTSSICTGGHIPLVLLPVPQPLHLSGHMDGPGKGTPHRCYHRPLPLLRHLNSQQLQWTEGRHFPPLQLCLSSLPRDVFWHKELGWSNGGGGGGRLAAPGATLDQLGVGVGG